MKLESVRGFGPASTGIVLCIAFLGTLFQTGCKSTPAARAAESAHKMVFNVRSFRRNRQWPDVGQSGH